MKTLRGFGKAVLPSLFIPTMNSDHHKPGVLFPSLLKGHSAHILKAAPGCFEQTPQ